jgi:RNA polymerase sigma-70 factor (ECF subfamily)
MGATRAQLIEEIPRLRRYARGLTANQTQADDLVQDCLERALGRLHLWSARGTVRSWLFTIMHNLYANRVRHEQTARRILAERPPVPPEQPGDADADAHAYDLDRALASLSDDHREVVLLVGLEQLSYREAATVLGVAEGTVMSRLSRARARLQALLEGETGAVVRHIR